MRGIVVVAEALGSEVLAHIQVDVTPVLREEVLEGLADASLDPADLQQPETATLVARLPAETAVQRGDVLTLTVNPHRAHFFDLEDGRAFGA